MKSIQIEFSKYESVNFLWSELIEHYGFVKAKKIVSQAIDLQKMNGNKNVTMPIIFSGTGGLALIPIQSLNDHSLKNLLPQVRPEVLGLALKNSSIDLQRRILSLSNRDYAERAYKIFV